MNNDLINLYNSRWEKLCSAMKPIQDNEYEVKAACPLLLKIRNDKSFKNAGIRLMIYGQETNSWNGKFPCDQKLIIENYDRFFNGGECWSYGGQFWNGINRFINLLEAKYADNKIELVWNNIVKIGRHNDKGFPPNYIYGIERECFSVIKEELHIIKPNLVLFLTGPNYDSVIYDNFGPLEKQALLPFSERQLSKVKLNNVDFAFRTYHPNYLWRNGIDDYFERIIQEISL